jgi:hypothetical protein
MERADENTDAPDPVRQQAYGTIVIVGGGCYGSYYVRQLRRARARGALTFDRLLVVDRAAACAAAASVDADLEMRAEEWGAFFSAFLAAEAREGDAIVPSPLMPHLLFQWLEQRARNRWPERQVSVRMPGLVGGIPWQREGRDDTRYVSFAEWICPVNCIEPRICPHTRSERTWSMPPSLAAHVKASLGTGAELQASVILHCTHRAYGVGMIDVDDVLAGDRTVVAAANGRSAHVLVGTVSHCHGALGVLAIE